MGYKKSRGIPIDIFSLVITITVGHFDVSRILNDGGSSCNIIYSKLLEKIGLKIENVWSYMRLYLQAFNDMMTHPLGYIELMLTLVR